jgi:RNA-binding protein YlmH
MLYSSVQRRRDGLKVGHPELEEHIQCIMSLADQYAFKSTDHFDPEEVMKVSQILHVERCG